MTDADAFGHVKSLVITRTGHEYYADKDAQLRERIEFRMAQRGDADVAAYLERLNDPDSDEWPLLESAVTINETFFFRFAEQFDALRRIVLPQLIARRREERRLRIWSVGCSTGAEPHSIAILLRDMLGDAIADWKIALTGTDIDEAALTVARAATYTSWSLRTLGEDERQRLFDRSGDRYRLKDRYRGIARFERHNLLSMIDRAAPLHFADYDLILCRNVLIYFSHDHTTRIVGALSERLADQGLLFVGHAEPNPSFDAVADAVSVGGVLAYRRKGLVERVDAELPVSPSPSVRPAPAVPTRPTASQRVLARRSAPLRSVSTNPPAVQSADETDQRTATRDPVRHYLSALGAMALGEKERAERGFRDALYLDTGFVMAHYLLGRHLLAEGRTVDGRRSLTNALRAASTLPPDLPLPEGDGLTAGSVVTAARMTLAVPA